MNTRILTPDNIEPAADLLRNGGLVVFPTETVYGLGADAENEDACRAIYHAKGRPADNPLIVHVASRADVNRVAGRVSRTAALLMEAFWPGPLTIVLPKNASVSALATAGLSTVAVRCPSHPVATRLISASRCVVAAPSANRSGRPSPTTFEMALADMDGRVDAIIDGGDCDRGIESTVVHATSDGVRILRPGSVTTEMLQSVIAHVDAPRYGSAYSGGDTDDGVHAGDETDLSSPGTRHAHYQPNAAVYVSEGVDVRALRSLFPGRSIGLIILSFPEGAFSEQTMEGIEIRRMRDLDDYARRLYREFAALDAHGCDVIVAQLPTPEGIGYALRDRLFRASGGRTLPHTRRSEAPE